MQAMAVVPQPGRHLGAGVRARPMVVAFVSGKGGVGTTATAAGVALAAVPEAGGPTAAVSIRSGPGSLYHRVTRATRPALPALAVADSAAWQPWSPWGDVVALVGRLRDGHPLTIVDVGDIQGDAAHRVLARADRIVLVTTPAADAVAAAGIALSRVRQIDPARLAVMTVAVVCLDHRQHRWTDRRLRAGSLPSGNQTVVVPFDPALTTTGLPDPDRGRAWPAYQRIAGLLTGRTTASAAAVPR